MKSKLFTFLLCISSLLSFAQSNPVPTRSDISVKKLMNVNMGVTRLAKDPVSGNLYYMNLFGNIYEIKEQPVIHDSLVFTAADHKITGIPQGLEFHDSVMYVSGNAHASSTITTGLIRKAVLQPNGSRVWSTVLQTEPYELSGFDNNISGMVLSPAGDSITFCLGSRTDHGEERDNGGAFPGMREGPLTTNLFRIPANDSTYFVNDSAWVSGSGFLFARGIRNTYDMAYDANNNLFGVENSGERDHNDEMNWLRRGKHYGFPWVMGDNVNPQQYQPYDPAADKLVNKINAGYLAGDFYNDPTFPAAPAVAFEKPMQNFGPDADKFRDSLTGNVKDASDLGISIGSITGHRTPLGLIFDNANALNYDFTGDAFMLSWNRGYLDSCGCRTFPDTAIGPYVDSSQDLLHLSLTYNSTIDNYSMTAHRIVGGFANPVDAVIDSTKIYVIEFGFSGNQALYEITMPVNTGVSRVQGRTQLKCYPNPARDEVTFDLSGISEASRVSIHNSMGHLVQSADAAPGKGELTLSTSALSNGVYFYEVSAGELHFSGKLVIIR
jgi:hypothetical protein